jgi:hypothetical protein
LAANPYTSRLDSACSLLAPVVELLSASGEANGVAYFYLLQHTIALAMRGQSDEAAAAVAALEKLRHPSWRCLDYQRAIAHAWVVAGQGAVIEAITLSLLAAETTRANGAIRGRSELFADSHPVRGPFECAPSA